MGYCFDNHKPPVKTEGQKANSFLNELWNNYKTDPEARAFLVQLGKKKKRNRQARKIMSR